MRLVLVLLTVFCLLFQQTVVAGSACAMDGSASAPATMSSHCSGMDMAKYAPSLCRSHCAPDPAVESATRFSPLQFILLPTPSLELLARDLPPDPGMPAITPVHRSDQPSRLRFCCLLI